MRFLGVYGGFYVRVLHTIKERRPVVPLTDLPSTLLCSKLGFAGFIPVLIIVNLCKRAGRGALILLKLPGHF